MKTVVFNRTIIRGNIKASAFVYDFFLSRCLYLVMFYRHQKIVLYAVSRTKRSHISHLKSHVLALTPNLLRPCLCLLGAKVKGNLRTYCTLPSRQVTRRKSIELLSS